MEPRPVEVVIVSGTLGAGKTAVTDEMSIMLDEAGVPHALVDVDGICVCYPTSPDDPWNEELALRNLAAMWANYRDRGARHLVLARAILGRDHLGGYREAIPGARVTVVRLTASIQTLRARIAAREVGSFRDWFLERVGALDADLDAAGVEELVVSNDGRPVRDVASEILGRLGWLA